MKKLLLNVAPQLPKLTLIATLDPLIARIIVTPVPTTTAIPAQKRDKICKIIRAMQ